jgi:hypothetical protein
MAKTTKKPATPKAAKLLTEKERYEAAEAKAWKHEHYWLRNNAEMVLAAAGVIKTLIDEVNRGLDKMGVPELVRDEGSKKLARTRWSRLAR